MSPRIAVQALDHVVKWGDETLPVWEFQWWLARDLGIQDDQDKESVCGMLLDLGVLTPVGEQVDNYNITTHPDRAKKILDTLAEW